MTSELLFDLIECYADVNIFLDRPEDEFTAKGAGLILTSNSVGHFPKKSGENYTLWFGRGIERWTFKTFRKAIPKIAEILKKINENPKLQVRFEGKEVKRFHRELAKHLQVVTE